MAAGTDPPLPPRPAQLADSEHGRARHGPQEGAAVGGCREGLQGGAQGSTLPFPGLCEMEEPQWLISEPPASHPAPALAE